MTRLVLSSKRIEMTIENRKKKDDVCYNYEMSH